MKFSIIRILAICISISLITCNNINETEILDEQSWKLGWRMIENSWNENYIKAEIQFDSMLSLNKSIGSKFLLEGLKSKVKLSKTNEAIKILSKQSKITQRTICEQEFVKTFEICLNLPEERIKNKKLQLEIIEMFLNDQSTRGNLMDDIIIKYGIDSSKIIEEGEIIIDEINRNRIKEIFWDFGYSNEEIEIIHKYIDSPEAIGSSMRDFISSNNFNLDWMHGASMVLVDEDNRSRLKRIIQEYGFPNQELIGKDAMRGVFFIIQHADGDKEWQKVQLPKLEHAVKKGDLSKQNYAYLFDRIRVNEGAPQRYGSQFENVNREKGIAKLSETEDLENLDNRRREMGMMPIETYRRLILKP